MSFLCQQSMVPSQDVDVDIRAGHWKISSRVQASSFSASFQVARLAGLPEGCLRGQISLSPTILMFWMLALFGRRGGMPSKRPFRELARRDWLRSRISSLKAEMLLAERVTPRRRLLIPRPIQELTSHGASFCFWLGFHYRSIEIAPYGGTVGGVDKAKISVEDPLLSFRAVSLFSPFSAFVANFLHRRFESG